jgi:hypothetical protein
MHFDFTIRGTCYDVADEAEAKAAIAQRIDRSSFGHMTSVLIGGNEAIDLEEVKL